MPVRVDADGQLGPTRGQARGPHWVRTSRGLHVPATVSRTAVEQRIVEAAAVLPPATGITGWAGLRWAGGAWFEGLTGGGGTELPVTLATGDSTIVAQQGFEISEEHLRPFDLTLLDGLPTTTNVRSVTYLMRYAGSEADAVAHLDMAAYNDLVSIDEVSAYLPTMPAWTGIARCRSATPQGDENAWSPTEVAMRLIWTNVAEFPRPLCNHPVFDRWGSLIGVPDLLDEEAGVVCEYDGALHLVGRQRRRDRDREEAFRRVGLEYFTMLGGDAADPLRVAARMAEVRSRALALAPSRRAWTIGLPRWWVPTFTVEQRRNLDEQQRARLLRLRRTA